MEVPTKRSQSNEVNQFLFAFKEAILNWGLYYGVPSESTHLEPSPYQEELVKEYVRTAANLIDKMS